MSVEYSYIATDWAVLASAPRDDEFARFLFDQMDDCAEWLAPVQFGSQIDHYYFRSMQALMLFNEWFVEIMGEMDPEFMVEFSTLFMDFGLLFSEETCAPQPIRAGVDISSDWLIAAIPPQEVLRLTAKAEVIDLDRLANQFQCAADRYPCEVIPDGETVRNWVAALQDGLRATSASGRGIIMGAA